MVAPYLYGLTLDVRWGRIRFEPSMNIRKQRFLSAVRIMAQDDEFIVNLAKRVTEEDLPEYPGSTALLFVTSFANLREHSFDSAPTHASFPCNSPCHVPKRARYTRPQSIPARWQSSMMN